MEICEIVHFSEFYSKICENIIHNYEFEPKSFEILSIIGQFWWIFLRRTQVKCMQKHLKFA